MAQQRPVYNIVFLLFDFVWKPGHYINFGKSFLKVESINNLFFPKKSLPPEVRKNEDSVILI